MGDDPVDLTFTCVIDVDFPHNPLALKVRKPAAQIFESISKLPLADPSVPAVSAVAHQPLLELLRRHDCCAVHVSDCHL